MPRHGQLNLDLKYGVIADCTTISFEHKPRPPQQGKRAVGLAQVRYTTIMATVVEHQPIPTHNSARTYPVVVAPHPGAAMVPTRGFDTNNQSSLQTYRYGHTAEQCGAQLLFEGPGGASREEIAGDPRPRALLPDGMMGFTRGQGVPMRELGAASTQPYSAMHHNHVYCTVWACGHGLVRSLPYDAALAWAQGKTRQTRITSSRMNCTKVCIISL